LINAIFSADVGTPMEYSKTFYKFGPGGDKNRSIAALATEASKISEECAAVVKAVILLPVLQWLREARSIDDVIENLPDDVQDNEEFSGLIEVQRQLLGFTDKPEIRLENRTRFFENCQRLEDVISSSLKKCMAAANTPSKFKRCLLCKAMLTGDFSDKDTEDREALSRRAIQHSFVSIIQEMADRDGEIISDYLSYLIPKEWMCNAENSVLYHNMDALMSVYRKILETYEEDGEWILEHASSYKNPEKLCDPRVQVAEYIKLIRSAVAMIEKFPGDNKNACDILSLLLDQQNEIFSDAEIALAVGIPLSCFNREKRKALIILGTILWGMDVNSILSLAKRGD